MKFNKIHFKWRSSPLQMANNPAPARRNHPRGQQYPPASHPPQWRNKQNKIKTTQTWASVRLKDIQWKPIKID